MSGVAVIGTAGRLPGARDLDTFWTNLLAGRDTVTRADVDELRGLVPDDVLDDARWIGASGRIDGVYDFDPEHFGMAPRTALITDPQHRLLLATVQHALEDAAVVPATGARVGVYAGVGRNRYADVVRAVHRATGEPVDELALEIGNEKDHCSTKVAFRLGFEGPAVTVQSACSSGLVALHQACQALAAQECDVAVVAAAAVRVPDVHGYLYLPGSIGSADGVCRSFSSRANGAVAGDGVVAVVLKRTEDAVADGDHVRAVVRGSAVNNDGAKSGYASVSARAQEAVIRDALLFAEVDAATVASIEAHGSATPLGDATEWSALTAVYGTGGRTLVGSVKSNLGHLREASGLAGLVRAVASLHHGVVPPTVNVGAAAEFTRAHDTGLELARTAQRWPRDGVRRAAVSAFGLGGTNVHVVLEEAPARTASNPPAGGPEQVRGPELVLVSARTATAMTTTAGRWADALRNGTPLATAAAVSQLGRRHRAHRTFAVGSTPDEVAADLAAPAPAPPAGPARDAVCLVFPGVGDQYTAMTAGLRGWLPGFDADLRRLLDACGRHVDRDLSGALATAPPQEQGRAFSLRRLVQERDGGSLEGVDTLAVHATVFSVQVALAQALQRLGVEPGAVVGHSLGELAAATVAGVFAEDDAVRVVMTRARLVDAQPPGAMLALSTSRAEAEALTGQGVWLAAVNSPRSCVVAGDRERVLHLADELAARGLAGRLLPVTQALHTPMMMAAADALGELLDRTPTAPPQVPLASNVTGGWVGDEVQRADYWHRHLTSTVLFGDALVTASSRSRVLLEVGPGQLRTLAAQCHGDLGTVVPTARREYQNERDDAVLLRALGALWRAGVEPAWEVFHRPGRSWRAPLPGTAFEERPLRVDDALGGVVVDLDGAQGAPVTSARPVVAPLAAVPAEAAGPAADPDGPPPDDAVLRALADVWVQVLGVPGLTPDADFFDLGGDSMMSVQLIRGLEQRLGFHVPAVVVFEESRLGRMARRITEWDRDEREHDA